MHLRQVRGLILECPNQPETNEFCKIEILRNLVAIAQIAQKEALTE